MDSVGASVVGAAVVGSRVGGLYGGGAVVAAVCIVNAVAVFATAEVFVVAVVVILVSVEGVAVGICALVVGGHGVLSVVGIRVIRVYIHGLGGVLSVLRVLCGNGRLNRLRLFGGLCVVDK